MGNKKEKYPLDYLIRESISLQCELRFTIRLTNRGAWHVSAIREQVSDTRVLDVVVAEVRSSTILDAYERLLPMIPEKYLKPELYGRRSVSAKGNGR